jgi:hypothetical protein
MAVRVVKEYDAASDFVFVTRERKVDFPTEGKQRGLCVRLRTSGHQSQFLRYLLHLAQVRAVGLGNGQVCCEIVRWTFHRRGLNVLPFQ